MRRLDITALSSTYAVRPLTPEDVDAVLALAAGNELFYRYHPPLPDRESILSDMTALPPGKGPEDKYFLGLFQGERLTAVMDLILGYPEADSAWMGWFILSPPARAGAWAAASCGMWKPPFGRRASGHCGWRWTGATLRAGPSGRKTAIPAMARSGPTASPPTFP